MTELHLVPIPIAVPLIVLTFVLTPALPAVWAAIVVTKLVQGVRGRQPPWQTALAISRWIGLSIVLPWAAVVTLSVMIVVQLALAPIALIHHLRNLRRTVHWISTRVEEWCRSWTVGMGMPSSVSATAAPPDLPRILRAYFSRRWFQRLWVLQEVALPELSRIRFVCGEKTTTGRRMMHLLAILKRHDGSEKVEFGRILTSFRQWTPRSPARSHLLDILIVTRTQHCQDPRDRIFGLLNISKWLDHGDMGSNPDPRVSYVDPVATVFASYSAQFIRQHGPGFFLSLIKSRANTPGLPSWAADWTVPWPNQRALAGVDFAARFKAANEKDRVLDFETEDPGRRMAMKITRPRIVRGFFTRDGQIDGTPGTHIENVRQLVREETLVEMYPGLALLLRKESGDSDTHAFVRVCPHSLSRHGVEKLVEGWGRVVVNQEDLGRQDTHGSPSRAYLSLPGVYKIV
ncbi:hypothetical protein BT67DRAFT_432816 [Trichocladium antarcticum]|uniref:Heterokaryon incompatibility domain-containing protein n=1 Tax=Trichocladium antarcticum TaxID=1450529 RepID=A0AAN6UMX9_9PEZI|nr:hypothetical protein BT67DRAFT_432816 [Trichocladium antarcticum]